MKGRGTANFRIVKVRLEGNGGERLQKCDRLCLLVTVLVTDESNFGDNDQIGTVKICATSRQFIAVVNNGACHVDTKATCH